MKHKYRDVSLFPQGEGQFLTGAILGIYFSGAIVEILEISGFLAH